MISVFFIILAKKKRIVGIVKVVKEAFPDRSDKTKKVCIGYSCGCISL